MRATWRATSAISMPQASGSSKARRSDDVQTAVDDGRAQHLDAALLQRGRRDMQRIERRHRFLALMALSASWNGLAVAQGVCAMRLRRFPFLRTAERARAHPDSVESCCALNSSISHVLFGKPVPTFRNMR